MAKKKVEDNREEIVNKIEKYLDLLLTKVEDELYNTEFTKMLTRILY